VAGTRVIIKKINPKSLVTEVQEFVIPLKDRHLFQLSEETVKEIKNKIGESIQRPESTGHLADSFFADKLADGYGIGNIDYLNQNAKQWYWIEYGVAQTGRRVPPGYAENPSIIGTFNPGIPAPTSQDFRGGRFQIGQRQSADGGIYALNPKKPIEPHNYISKTVARISEIINLVLKRVK
jgi:hypothetical protein